MQKAEVYVTTKIEQNKASPTESEIHPSHKPAVYAPRYFATASSQTQLLAGAPGESRVSSGLCSEDRSCGGPSPLKISINRCFFSPVPMAFPYRQRLRAAMQPGNHTDHRSVRKIHARQDMFCRNHPAPRCDNSAKMPAALFARKRAYARDRFA